MQLRVVFTILAILLLGSYAGVYGLEQWGEATEEELAMDSIPQDPDADAAILLHEGYFSPIGFTEYKRVKVFTRRGTQMANVSIPVYFWEEVGNVKGFSVSPDGEQMWLDPDRMYTKHGRYRDEVVFTVPGVLEGSVFGYQYSKVSGQSFILGPWYFQNEVFTKESRLHLSTVGMTYSYRFINPGRRGTAPSIGENEVWWSAWTMVFSSNYNWSFENLPALEIEPYMPAAPDYQMAVYFERVGYWEVNPDSLDPVDTWEEMGWLVDSIYCDLPWDTSEIKALACSLASDPSDGPETARQIYQYVRDSLEWNGRSGIFGMDEEGVDSILVNKRGSAAEINLLLVRLLQAAGFESRPLLIGTRDHLELDPAKPGFFQLHRVLARFLLGEEVWLADATDPYCPFGALPVEDVVKHGLLLDGENSELIEVETAFPETEEHFVNQVQLREDGGFDSRLILRRRGYLSDSARRQVIELGGDLFVENQIYAALPTAAIDSLVCPNPESIGVEETFEISAKLSTFHHGQIIGERMYVNPVIFSRMASNPFRSENRSYPVDFGYPYTTVEETELSVPKGFRVEEVPEDVSFKMTGAKFDLSFSADSAQVRCVRRLTVIQPVCRPYLYVALRKFFEKIVSADRQQVVLVKEPG